VIDKTSWPLGEGVPAMQSADLFAKDAASKIGREAL
jgi:hypothetical protein